MPRTAQVNERIRDEQRAKILDAARKVLAHRGRAATMDDIAAEAGVSHGLAYRYFPNKDAILRALVEQAIRASPELASVHKRPGTPGQRLSALLTEFVNSRRERPEFFQLLDHVLHDEEMPDEFRRMLQRRHQLLRKTLRQLIVAGQKTGEVTAGDPDQLVWAILASMDGLTRSADGDSKNGMHFPDAAIFLRMLRP